MKMVPNTVMTQPTVQFLCGNPTILRKCFFHTSALNLLSMPFIGCSQMKQILCQIITNAMSIDQTSLLKIIDFSFSSSPSVDLELLFTQLQDFIDTNVCNSIIRSYNQSRKHLRSILVYTKMHNCGILPDSSTFPSVLKSTAQLSCIKIGRSIHARVVHMGFDSDVFTNTALVTMYASCESTIDARRVFDEMPERNSVSWNAMITGHAHNREFREALSMFQDMQLLGVDPSEVTMVSTLSSCAHLGALNQGRWIHNYINQNGFTINVFVGTALIDMYAKCGVVDECEKVFQELSVKNVFTWNALISGFAMNGLGEGALEAFWKMIKENFTPDGVTLLAVLCACSHQGLVNEGRKLFASMERDFGLQPKVEHYGCMVDLLGRAGYLEEAKELICTMPMKPDVVVWRALLGACRIHRNVEMSEFAIGNLLRLEPENGENYVLLSNLFARDQRWGKIEEVREMMIQREIQKVPGCSSIEIDNFIYEFMVSDQLEKMGLEDVHRKLADMNKELKLAGYVADTDLVSFDVGEEEKEESLMYHSEKLALAFGLLRTPPGIHIRIMKNLRVCGDCHCFFKLVSKVYQRKITVRDRSRFHHFVAGDCSCREYW